MFKDLMTGLAIVAFALVLIGATMLSLHLVGLGFEMAFGSHSSRTATIVPTR